MCPVARSWWTNLESKIKAATMVPRAYLCSGLPTKPFNPPTHNWPSHLQGQPCHGLRVADSAPRRIRVSGQLSHILGSSSHNMLNSGMPRNSSGMLLVFLPLAQMHPTRDPEPLRPRLKRSLPRRSSSLWSPCMTCENNSMFSNYAKCSNVDLARILSCPGQVTRMSM